MWRDPTIFLSEGYEYPEQSTLFGRGCLTEDDFAMLERDPLLAERLLSLENGLTTERDDEPTEQK